MPIPLSEKGLTGVEKYPFFGKKNEKDMPTCCERACPEKRMAIRRPMK